MKIDLSGIADVDKIAIPEVVLWLAVIERAMLDAVYPKKDLGIAFRRDLYDFFYNEVPRPHNLVYICNILFDISDAHLAVRKRLEAMLDEPDAPEFIRSKRYKGYY